MSCVLIFLRQTSHLDLSDPLKSSDFASLISSPTSSTITFLNGLTRLYHILIRMEFGASLFRLPVPTDLFQQSHESWLSIMQHAHSLPLSKYLEGWLSTDGAIDVEAERQRLNQANSAEQLAEQRGRFTCKVCQSNQTSQGSDIQEWS